MVKPNWLEEIRKQEDDMDKQTNWQVSDGVRYCDKGAHKQRSIYHQPRHIKHWKKQWRRVLA